MPKHAPALIWPRRRLRADALIGMLRSRFEDVADCRRQSSVTYSMNDTLMSAFAMFLLKDPSLLAFEERGPDRSISKLYQIGKVPSDSSMPEILDGIDTEPLNECFADLFYELQRGGVLKQSVFDNVTDPNDPKTVLSETQSISDLPLNASTPDVRVNFL